MEKNRDYPDLLRMLLFTVLLCGIIAFIVYDFYGIVMGFWYGSGRLMNEFGRVIEQLPL